MEGGSPTLKNKSLTKHNWTRNKFLGNVQTIFDWKTFQLHTKYITRKQENAFRASKSRKYFQQTLCQHNKKKKKKITNGNHLIIALTISLLVLDATLKYYANHPSVSKIKSFNPDWKFSFHCVSLWEIYQIIVELNQNEVSEVSVENIEYAKILLNMPKSYQPCPDKAGVVGVILTDMDLFKALEC